MSRISMTSLIKRLRLGLRLDEQGAALITALMFLLVLTMLGLATVMTSGTEMMISRNYRLNTLALDYANAGVNEAMARMDLQSGPLALGSFANKASAVPLAEVDNVWGFTSSDSGADIGFINFSGTVSYRLEDPLHHHPLSNYTTGAHVVTGYSSDSLYDQSPIKDYSMALPVYVVVSKGKVMSGPNVMATAKVRVEVTRTALNIYAPGGVFSGSCPNLNGSPLIDGGAKPGIMTNAACTLTAPDNNNVTGSTGGAADNPSTPIDMNDYLGFAISDLKGFADQKFTNTANTTLVTPTGYGTDPDGPIITYWDNTDPSNYLLKISNLTGAGVLIVEGDIDFGGSMNWHGLIYVKGNATFSGGGGAQNIWGALMAEGNVQNTLGGSVEIRYDEAALENVAKKAFRSKMINWQRQYN